MPEEKNAFQRGAEDFADFLSNRSAVGAFAAGAMNTEGSRLRRAKMADEFAAIDERAKARQYEEEQRAYGREQMNQGRAAMAEWFAGADDRKALRKAQVDAAKADAQRASLNADMMRDQRAENEWQQTYSGILKSSQESVLNGNPIAAAWTPEDQKAFFNSPAVRAQMEFATAIQMFQNGIGGNRESLNNLENYMRRKGYSFQQSEDGSRMTVSTPDGRTEDVTPESIQRIMSGLNASAANEFKARAEVAAGLKSGNAVLMRMSQAAGQLAALNGGNMTVSRRAVEQIFNGSGNDKVENEKDKAVYAIASAYNSIKRGNLTPEMSAMVLQNAAGALAKLGIQCVDVSNPLGSSYLRQYVDENGEVKSESLTFDGLGEMMVSQDKIGAQLDGMVNNAIQSKRNENERTFLAGMRAAQQEIEKMEGKGKGDVADMSGGNEESGLSDNELASLSGKYGTPFLRLKPELQQKMPEAESLVNSIAAQAGVFREGNNGNAELKPDVTREQIIDLADKERAVFEEYGLDEFIDKAFFNRVLKLFNAKKNISEEDKKQPGIKKLYKSAESMLGDSSGNRIIDAVSFPGRQQAVTSALNAAGIADLLSSRNRKRSEDEVQKQEKALENR